jgi:hypothetical protein
MAPIANPTGSPIANPTDSPVASPTSSPVTPSPVTPAPVSSGTGDTSPGKATFYGGNENGNACGYTDLPYVSFPFGFGAAAGGENFRGGLGCGACFEITCEGPYGFNPSCLCDAGTPTVVVQVNDWCPECPDTHFDLNPNSMELITGDGLAGTCGEISTQIRRVNCDFQSNIKIRSKGGTSANWYALHVDDVAGYGDISTIRLRAAGSQYFDITCDKSGGPSFWICDIAAVKPISAPLDVELTDSAGRILIGEAVITNLSGQTEFDFGSNFPDIPPDVPTDSPTKAPATPAPTPVPTVTARPSAESMLLTTMEAKNAWEVFDGLQLLTKINSVSPPSYSLVAS